jgi:hypothetical protein
MQDARFNVTACLLWLITVESKNRELFHFSRSVLHSVQQGQQILQARVASDAHNSINNPWFGMNEVRTCVCARGWAHCLGCAYALNVALTLARPLNLQQAHV